MTGRWRLAIAPSYLALCLVLGGSAQGVWGNLLLQLLAILLLGWSLLTRSPSAMSRGAQALAWLAGASVLLLALQLVPLPPALWTALPGRGPVAAGYTLLGLDLPWLPLSLNPYQSLDWGLALLSPLATGVAILRLGAYRSRWIAIAIVLTTLAGVALGAAQVTSGSGYLYRFTSIGQAAGFFANANYMGTLLLTALPFLAALYVRLRERRRGPQQVGIMGIALGASAVILLGLVLNGSTAALILSVPVLLASTMLILTPSSKLRPWLVAGGLLALAAGALALLTAPRMAGDEATISMETRQTIYERSAIAAADYFPFGSGLGSFASVYPQFENPDAVDWVFVNHAHNEYLELTLEAGLPAVLLIIAFLVWWVRRAIHIWRSPVSGAYAKAATIASAAILSHSLVDFPARTSAIAGVLAASVALMAEPRPRKQQPASDVRSRPARHLSLP